MGQPGDALSGIRASLCPSPFCSTGAHPSVVMSTLYLNGIRSVQQGQNNFLCSNGALTSTLPSLGWANSSSTAVDGGPGVTLEYCGTEGFGGPGTTVSSINLTLYYREAPGGKDNFSAYLTNIPCQPRAYDPYYPESQTSCYLAEHNVRSSAPALDSGCGRTTISWTPPPGLTLTKGEPVSLVLFFPHEAAGGQGEYSQSIQVCSGSGLGTSAAQHQNTPSSITIRGNAMP
jgi:hypothetical protein